MLTIHDEEFKRFGQVLNIDTKEIVAFLEKAPLPECGNIYVASDPKFEELDSIKELASSYFGSLPMQAGYCNGHNQMLNATEYHGCIEINVASDDCSLFLGTLDQIKEGKIASEDFAEVLVKKGEAILVYPGTLHFSPCVVKGHPFHMAVLLSKGTNTPLESKTNDPTLWMNNKWLIAHKDSVPASKGAYVGITGENRRAGMAE